MQIVKVKKLHPDAFIPTKAYPGDAGFDLNALEDTEILLGETIKIRTGLAFELPIGYEMQVRPRSGLGAKSKLRIVLGTVDSEYRGEIHIIADNISTSNQDKISISAGDRIAQAIIQKLPHVALIEVAELNKGVRGANGFGSTGINHEY